MNVQRIFISTPWFTPAYKAGGPIQSIANMIEAMKDGYQFYIFCSNVDVDEVPINLTAVNAWTTYNEHTQVWYATKTQRSKHLVDAVEKIKPNALYMIGLFSPIFTLVPLFFAKAPLKILSVRGMLHPGALGTKTVKKNIYIAALKALNITERCVFHATDAAELDFIKEVFGKNAKVHIASNFPKGLLPQERLLKIENHLVLVSICLIGKMKNILLVLEALEQCTAQVVYNIYGPIKDISYWEQCLLQIRKLPTNISVNYLKDCLPPEIPIILQKSHVFILPSKSENYGHAIIDALSAGVPVIISKHTPWNNLEATGAGFNVENNRDAIFKAVQQFAAMDDLHYKQSADAASIFARDHIDLTSIMVENTKMFNLAML